MSTVAAGVGTAPLDGLVALTRALRPATLAETIEVAALQTRIDRKYVVAPSVVDALVEGLGAGLQALEIGGERCFAYESVYFDTPSRESFRGASTQRRRRWKVRTRTYVASAECMLEVKTRGARGETAKDRLPYAVGVRRHLTAPALAFVTERVMLPEGGRELAPVLTTSYRRATLLDAASGMRLTIDAGLRCTAEDGQRLVLPDHVIVETKSTGAPTTADRALWRLGARPVPMSKFGVGMAGTHAGHAANRWHRPLRRFFVAEDAAPRTA